MDHKGLTYNDINDLIDQTSLERVQKAWDKSLAHQIPKQEAIDKMIAIDSVLARIRTYLS